MSLLEPVRLAYDTADRSVRASLATADVAVQAALDARDATIADLQQQLTAYQHPTPPPVGTLFGINASNKAQHDANAALFGPVKAWRYYHQPGEPFTYPSEYQLGAGEVFVLSGKVLPQHLTLADALDAGHKILLPQHLTTSVFLSLFQSCPTDRPTYVCVWHEPEDDIAAGHFTSADLKAAWDRARSAQQQVGDHIVLVPILMGYTFEPSSKRNVDDYIPADASWDHLFVDTYFAGSIGGAVSTIPTAFDAPIAYATAHGKGWGVTETGVGKKVTGTARQSALTLLARTLRAKDARVGIYFVGTSNSSIQWGLDAAELAAWGAGQAA